MHQRNPLTCFMEVFRQRELLFALKHFVNYLCGIKGKVE